MLSDDTRTQGNQVNCLIVCGMHRSGTSVLAGCFHLLGVDLGKNLMGPSTSNELGHWENHDITLAHDILLRDLGCQWDMIGSLPKGWLDSEAANRARKTLRAALERNFDGSRLWAVKDPRIARLLPLWLRILRDLKVTPGFIVTVRHPFEVARSLQKRNGFDLRKGHLLWLTHNRDAFAALMESRDFNEGTGKVENSEAGNKPTNTASQSGDRTGAHARRRFVVVTYDRLLADPVATLRGIEKDLAFTFPRPVLENAPAILAFVRPDLKHHHVGDTSPEEPGDEPFPHFAALYERFRAGQNAAAHLLAVDTYAKAAPLLPEDPGMDLPFKGHVKGDPSPGHSTQPSSDTGRRLWNELLDLVGDYERLERDARLQRELRILTATRPGDTLFAQVYVPSHEGKYDEAGTAKILLPPAEWYDFKVPISRPEVLRRRSLRIDPLNTRGAVAISRIALVSAVTGKPVWDACTPQDFDALVIQKDAARLPSPEGLFLMVFGHDPQILLPPLPDLPDHPMELRVWIKAELRQESVAAAWKEKQREIARLSEEITSKDQQLGELQQTLDQLQAEHQKKLEGLQSTVASKDQQLGELQQTLDRLKAEHQRKLEELQSTVASKDQQLGELQKALDALKAEHTNQLEGLRNDLRRHRAVAERSLQLVRQAQEERAELRATCRRMAGTNAQLNNWLRKLSKDVNALRESKRWKVGNTVIRIVEILLFRKKEALALDHMTQIFAEYEARKQDEEQRSKAKRDFRVSREDVQRHRRWLEQLRNDFDALEKSLRWKVGSSAVRLFEVILFRWKAQTAADHMRKIFAEFQAWVPTPGKEPQDLERLRVWLRKLRNDFDALMHSWRWKLGNTVLTLTDYLLLRGRKPTAADHMREIFKHYQHWASGKPTENQEPVDPFDTLASLESELKRSLLSSCSYSDALRSIQAGSRNAKSGSPPTGPSTSPAKGVATISSSTEEARGKNVLFVLPQPIESNSGYHVQLLAERLAPYGISSIIAVPDESATGESGLRVRVCSYAEIDGKGFPFPDGRGPDILHAWTPREIVRQFAQKILESNPCSLIIHLEDNEEYLTEVTLAKPFSELANLPEDELDKLIPRGRFHPIRGRQFLDQADGLTMVIETLNRFNPGDLPTMILPPIVDERLFYPRPMNKELRSKLAIPDDHIVLVYSGNVHSANVNEVAELYKAVILLNEQGHPTTLIRTGKDIVPLPKEAQAAKQFEKHLGWVKREELPDILAAADMFVQPGEPGPFNDYRIPSKLPEYFAMGRPVLMTSSNLGRHLRHNRSAYILRRANADAIRAGIIALLNDHDLYITLSNAGIDHYLTHLVFLQRRLLSFYTYASFKLTDLIPANTCRPHDIHTVKRTLHVKQLPNDTPGSGHTHFYLLLPERFPTGFTSIVEILALYAIENNYHLIFVSTIDPAAIYSAFQYLCITYRHAFSVMTCNDFDTLIFNSINRPTGDRVALLSDPQLLTKYLALSCDAIILDQRRIQTNLSAFSLPELSANSVALLDRRHKDNNILTAFTCCHDTGLRCTLVTSIFRSDAYLDRFLSNCQDIIGYNAEIAHTAVISQASDFESDRLRKWLEVNTKALLICNRNDPGLYECWNIAIRSSNTPFISNANVDDLRHPQQLKTLLRAFDVRPHISVAASALVPFEDNVTDWGQIRTDRAWYSTHAGEFGFLDLARLDKTQEGQYRLIPHNIPHCMPVWKKTLHSIYGYFNEKRFGTYADWAFWLKVMEGGERGYLEPTPLSFYFINPKSHNRRGDQLGTLHSKIEREYLHSFLTRLHLPAVNFHSDHKSPLDHLKTIDNRHVTKLRSKRYLFICGCPRSGTTALWQLITSHPQIALGLERYYHTVLVNNHISPRLFDKDRFFASPANDTFYDDLYAFSPYYSDLRPRYDQCIYFGDKIPTLYLKYHLLADNLPNATILFIIRDIYSVASSYNRRAANPSDKHWSRQQDYKVAVDDWNESLLYTNKALDTNKIGIVDYHRLFNVGAHVQSIFHFLDIDCPKEVISAYSTLRKKSQTLSRARTMSLTEDMVTYILRMADFDLYKQLIARSIV